MLAAFNNIKCFVLDVDGVLTNGQVIVMPNGILVRTMNIKDGYALQLAIKKGYKIWVISGGRSEEVIERLKKLGVNDVFMSVTDKKQLLSELMLVNQVSKEEVLFMGDDMPDFEAMKSVGMAACPSDAVEEIKAISNYIALAKGGEGCVREVIEKTLKLKDHWDLEDHIPAQ